MSVAQREAAKATANERRQEIVAAKADLRAGIPPREVFARPEVGRMRLAGFHGLLKAIPRIGEAKAEKILRSVEGETGTHTNRLFVRKIGELTAREIDAVLRRV